MKTFFENPDGKWPIPLYRYSLEVLRKPLFVSVVIRCHTGQPPYPYYRDVWHSGWFTSLEEIDREELEGKIRKYGGNREIIEEVLNANS